jgi:hypothetical protein
MKFSNFANFFGIGISEQFANRKCTISIYRTTSIFDLQMQFFNLHRAPQKNLNLKKKYAEIDFTSRHSFLRLRKVKKINSRLPHTKKTQPTMHAIKKRTHELAFLQQNHIISVALRLIMCIIEPMK